VSSKAKDRSLEEWFSELKKGAIKLPRFQRYEAWDRHRVASLLKTVIHDLPLGITLILEVDKEQFQSRYLETAIPEDTTTRVTEHLLDGQQRLTALWRTLHNNYEDTSYFVYVPELENYYDYPWSEEWEIYVRTRYYKKNGKRYPLWADEPDECLLRGCIPTDLLKPIDMSSEISEWVKNATIVMKPTKDATEDPSVYIQKYENYLAYQDKVKEIITRLRENVKYYNLPYLALPSETNKDVALQVFINMNTNSKPLTRYDIIVAEIEAVRGESLHDLHSSLDKKYPFIKAYEDLNKLILNVSALLQDKLPNERGAIEMDKSIMLDNWNKLEMGLNKMVNFLEEEGILDATRLPTNAVLAVIAALLATVPDKGDVKGQADKLIKKYLWSSFFTDRYENSAATHAYSDYLKMKEVINAMKSSLSYDEVVVPVLNREVYPLADIEELMESKWPKRAIIRSRAILAVSTYCGALDFADGKSLSRATIGERDYHHLYPDSLLKEAGIESSIALNCALITDETNRNLIRRKDPSAYVDERIDWSDEDTIRNRIESHIIPFKELMVADYQDLQNDEKHHRLIEDFQNFIEERAKLIYAAADLLVKGYTINFTKVEKRKNELFFREE
jgi:hypothetical protein